MQKHVVIIGAGFGGLSAAAYMAKAGYKVTVLEKNSSAGGRAMVEKTKGFTFDLGPSWYMMPDVFDDFFANFDKKTSDYYSLEKLNPSYRVYTNDEVYDVSSADQGGLDLFEKIEPGSSKKIKKLLKKTKNEYKTVRKSLLELDYTKKSNINAQLLKMVTTPALLQSYHNRISNYVKDKDLQKILEFMVVFMGGSPKNIPALYTLLAYVDLGLGIWYPKGGFGAVVSAFQRLGGELGATYRFNAEVTKISTVDNKVDAVWVGSERIACDSVIANADYHWVETELLTQNTRTYSENYWSKKTISPSGFMMYLGVNKKVAGLAHHTLFLDTSWDNHFNQVFKSQVWSDKPLFYVGSPSKSDTSVAPKSCENIFVLAPMANNVRVDEEQKNALCSSIIKRIEQKTSQRFSNDISVKNIRDIDYFEQTFNAYKGNSFGLAHTLKQSAVFRPKIKSKKVSNLFYAGHYTSPGTGVPMVVLSGKIAAKLASEQLK